ncbi:phage portal protein [Exilibacterium tricleocarpae]|uniref:Phage portal protein n=1 Tax=Exilibacterium tricleocarpae TaxID=2591008 RepID=A0A545U6V2_9GAMM|nr:phage portal protein [Exilibacterium tricleocarpae]TQV85200.1 phage portal protein [Exilibacterium tricleocarpae]
MRLNGLDRVIAYFDPIRAHRRARARFQTEILSAQADYDAGGRGRRWFRGTDADQNTVLRRSLPTIRAAARELDRNNVYVETANWVVTANTIGVGITPVAKHPTSKRKKQLADRLMTDWANSTQCDFTGRHNLFGLQALAMHGESLSGESLAIRRMSRNSRLAIPLQLQLLEGDYLDHQKNQDLNGDTQVIQGVELRGGRRSRYWLFDQHPGESGRTRVTSEPVSADQVAHVYDERRIGQVRGIPRGVSVFTKVKGLDDFQDARIEQQKIAACLAAFITAEDESTGNMLPEKLEPGLLARLKQGEQVLFNTPPSVSGQSEFVRGEEHLIAAGWGITYESLTGDHSLVNFASGKMGRIQMYANINRWRKHMFIPHFCKTVERWFLAAAAFRGHDLAGVTFDWTPPKKEILDIKNEMPAIIQEVRAGGNSLSGSLRERGVSNPREMLQELAEDFEFLDELGLVLDSDPRRTTRSGQLQAAATVSPNTDGDNEDDNEDDDEAAGTDE